MQCWPETCYVHEPRGGLSISMRMDSGGACRTFLGRTLEKPAKSL